MNFAALAEYLEHVAKTGKPVTYSDLVAKFDLPPLDGAWTSHPLHPAFDRLDQENAEQGRPFRTCVVISKELNRPGDGFFKSLFELKGISAKSDIQKMEAFLRELDAVKKYPWKDK